MKPRANPLSTSLLVDCGAINCQAADESGFAHDMPRTHGYSLRGQRCPGKHDWNARGRINVIGALLAGALLIVGLTTSNVDAPSRRLLQSPAGQWMFSISGFATT